MTCRFCYKFLLRHANIVICFCFDACPKKTEITTHPLPTPLLFSSKVGYEIGSKGQSLPAAMVNNLDTFLVPIVHQASEEGVVMELVFCIVE